MTKRVGVLLSGCGYLDGAEVQEATLTLYFLDRAGVEIVAMAPDKPQADTVDHNAGAAGDGVRNVRVESARITRGNVRDVADVSAADLDALVIPGGFGVAKNLCSFATDGPECSVDPGVEKLIRDMHSAKKPLGALCIAPALLARVLGPDHGVRVTIGNDADTAGAIVKMGGEHQNSPVEGIVVDETNRVVTTPCYMLGPGPAAIGAGAEKLVNQLLAWI